jgi:hypothetical protein
MPWASIGITSLRETFWLMPAILRKDRKGPGITTVSAEGAADNCLAESTCLTLGDREPSFGCATTEASKQN